MRKNVKFVGFRILTFVTTFIEIWLMNKRDTKRKRCENILELRTEKSYVSINMLAGYTY
jgi:hypothetical protein